MIIEAVSTENGYRNCSGAEASVNQLFAKADPLKMEGVNFCNLLIVKCVHCSEKDDGAGG